MSFKSFATTATVLLAAVRLACASGSTLTIKNSCGETLAINKCQNGDNWLPPVAPGDTSEPLGFDSTTSGGTGVSYKIYPQSNTNSEPMQFEYSAGVGDGQIWYDLSNIDGYPQMFVDKGVTVTPKGTGSNCKEILCPAGERKCTDAYNLSNDDKKAMRNCDTGCELEVHICSGGKSEGSTGGSGGSGSGSGGEQPPPTPVYGGYTPSSTFVTSTSQAPPPPQYNQVQAEGAQGGSQNNNNALKEDQGGKVYVPQDNNPYVATTVVYSQETQYVQAPAQRMHRRHNHGHAHHHQ